MNLRKYLVFTYLILLAHLLGGQEVTPLARNWTKVDHGFANQIWSATCDERGIMYFGNEAGVMSFDSHKWRAAHIAGGSTVRSVFYDQGRIYCGSFEEFGYYQRIADGTLSYTSLYSRLPDYYKRNNDEIWTIFKSENKIIFHAFRTIFLYDIDNDLVSFVRTKELIRNIGIDSKNRILCSAHGFSFLDMKDGTCAGIPHPWKGRMVALIPREDKGDLVITVDDGIYLWKDDKLSKWHTNCEDKLINGHINCAYITKKGEIIVGSYTHGCTMISAEGNKIWSLDASNVLSGNSVHSICENRENDLFLCLDSGIAIIDNNTGIRYISAIEKNIGTIYCVQYKAPYLYMGSNQGLYVGVLDSETLTLSKISQFEEINGPIRYIKEYDGQIICGSRGDTYTLTGRQAQRLSQNNAGGNCISKAVIDGQEVLVEGTYTKLCIYRKVNGKWAFSNQIEGFDQPISSIDVDFSGTIWAGHYKRGLYKVNLDESLKRAVSQTYYPSLNGKDNRIKVKRIGGRSVFYDRNSFYTYDYMRDSIISYRSLNEKFNNVKRVVNISDFDNRRYWLLTEDDVLLMDTYPDSEPLYRIPYNVFSSNSVDQLNEVKPGPKDWYIITLDNSLAFIPPSVKTNNQFIPHIALFKASISRNDGSDKKYLALNQPLVWNYSSRLVQFTYSYPYYKGIGNNHLEFRLKGRDKQFIKAAGEVVDLSYLPEGRYTLEVRIVNRTGKIMDTTTTDFRIRPPFWRSIPARILYVLIVLALLAHFYTSVKHKIKTDKIALENRNMEIELNAKSREIAITTMSLINKNKMLTDLKEEIQSHKSLMGSVFPDKYYRKIISEINSQISTEQDWQIFQENFDNIHTDFFKILRSRYPSLTDSDLRFCSYLCMNLSSKEIASLMNISLKGVEAARYRIRKKLGLPSDVSLSAFLMDLK